MKKSTTQKIEEAIAEQNGNVRDALNIAIGRAEVWQQRAEFLQTIIDELLGRTVANRADTDCEEAKNE